MKRLFAFFREVVESAPEKNPLLFANIDTLSGLRGLCMLWVMFVHLPTYAVPSALNSIHDHWRFGVNFFFAISGFLVTRSLYQCHVIASSKGQGMGFAMKEYMIRRVSRIFPPYYLTLALLFGLALITHNNFYAQLKEVARVLPSFPLFYANYMIPGVLERLPHTFIIFWSVSFQEQFYFLLALFAMISFGRLRHLLFFAGLFSIVARFFAVFCLWKGQRYDYSNFMETWLHLNFDALSWGCLVWYAYDALGVLWKTPRRAMLSSMVISALTFFTICDTLWWQNNLAFAVTSVFKAPLIALSVRMICELEKSNGFLARILKNKRLGKLGLVSFEVYLVHVLIYGFVSKAIPSNGPLFLAVAYPVAITIGYFYYKHFGKPAQEWTKRVLRALKVFDRPALARQAAK